MANYTVNAYNNNGVGGTVNMRAGASTGAAIVKQVPHGAPVTGTRSGTWSYMTYNQKTPTVQTYSGYMMSVYLDAQGSGGTGTSKSGVVALTSGTLNVRSGPTTGHPIIGSLQNGEAVTYLDAAIWGSNMTWYQLISPHYGSYVATQYIQPTGGPGSGGSSGGGVYLGQGLVTGGGPLYCRKQPITGYADWGRFQEHASIPIYACSVAGWYETRWPANGTDIGFVMSQYVTVTGGQPMTLTYNNAAAVAYAKNHSDNTGAGKVCPMRNTSFGGYATNGCATFVSQCLCAGGLPMFNGWHYDLPGIPPSWGDSKWNLTYSGYQKLNGKGRLSAVLYNMVQPGDIIYTYDASQSPPNQYPHVTIATSAYGLTDDDGQIGCTVCGHTTNQNEAFKPLTAADCRCYRVNRTITVGTDEKRVWLPSSGNGGIVL